jgi:7-cyano-7-deazaguanine synthase in queuosine biosynthesis
VPEALFDMFYIQLNILKEYIGTWCDYEVAGMILLRDLKEAMLLDRSKDTSAHASTCTSCYFNINASTCGSCNSDNLGSKFWSRL